MKIILFFSILSVICAEIQPQCEPNCAAVLCARVNDDECGPDSHVESGDLSKCQCCPRCVPNKPIGNLYDSCESNKQCGLGLKCSQAKKLCVNNSCDDNECQLVKCASVDECKEGYYKQYSMCGCCSSCAAYLGVGGNCSSSGDSTARCQSELVCDRETGICVRRCGPKDCDVGCAGIKKGPQRSTLKECDSKDNRCCAGCDDQNNNGGLYDACQNDKQCGPDLKCSEAIQLCVNSSCPDIKQCLLKCMRVDKCKDPGTYVQYSQCGCCSFCAKYSDIGEICSSEGVRCKPGLECSQETGKCEKICDPSFCDVVRCANPGICKKGEILRESDTSKCRCCSYCEPDPNYKGDIYDPCQNDSQCGPKLKCSISLKLCVNESCPCTKECLVRCAVVNDCPENGTYKQYFACGCCSYCSKYLGIGENCTTEGSKCSPELVCSKTSGTCERKCKVCNVFCILIENRKCPVGQVFLPKDPKECRCCDSCVPNVDTTV